MAHTFITFLGLGRPPTEAQPKALGYDELEHFADGHALVTTPFAQEAAVLASGMSFDRIVVLVTEQSRRRHGEPLLDRLAQHGISKAVVHFVSLPNADQRLPSQWLWFEAVLKVIDEGDDVVFDFTHGFRSVPIVLSSAISFLRKAKKFHLRHAFYIFVDKARQRAEVIDLASFYEVNDWADALNALLNGADTSPLALLAADPTLRSLPALGDPALIAALNDLTRAVKDVDMNGVAERALAALAIVEQHLCQENLGSPERCLLEAVRGKFAPLGIPDSGRIDGDYFRVQLALAGLMLDHGLRMQGYTVMRELIGSVGILGAKPKYRDAARTSSRGREARRQFADPFFNMCQFDPERWRFARNAACRVEELRPHWAALGQCGVRDELVELAKAIASIRNGLDHGWTAAPPADARQPDQSRSHLNTLVQIVERMGREGLLSGPES